MNIIKALNELQLYIKKTKLAGKTIGFVPTMGFFHQGHLSLVEASKQQADVTVVSIFVNPLQFGGNEDLDVYPRDEQKDLQKLEALGVDVVFIPDVEGLYGTNFSTYVEVQGLSDVLCGESRPGHFRGVSTVVLKLLNIVQPDKLFLGQKDAQQVVVIKKMVQDLSFPCEVCVRAIVREPDGLAMSSRNSYLSEQERKNATVIYNSLCEAEKMVENGEKNAGIIEDKIVKILSSVKGLKIDYVKIVDGDSLQAVDCVSDGTLIAVAGYIGKTRLIDNLVF